MPDFLPAETAVDAEPGETGGRLVARALKHRGVDTLFALCGGHVLPLLDGCIDEGIRVIDHRHEGSAALAAEGWALATGEPGVAAVTAGPGFANAVIGLVDAGTWSVPLVLIAGRTSLGLWQRGAVQDTPQAAIATPVSKEVLVCLETGRLPEMTEDALYLARAGRPGPVYLEVPQDVMSNRVEVEQTLHGRPPEIPVPSGAPDDLRRVRDVLEAAEKPVILAGGGAFWSGAADALTRFVETAEIPVTTTSTARGLVPDSHDWCLGTLVHGGAGLLAADVVLVLGSEFNANVAMGRAPLFTPEQTVVQVDLRPEGIGGNRRPDHAVVGDVATVLDALTDSWSGSAPGRDRWLADCHTLVDLVRSTWDAQIDGHDGDRVHAGAVAREMVLWARDTLGDGVTFVADGGDALTWGLAYMYAERAGRTLHTTTALGTLGVGLPFAIAAQAARPDERALLFVGDGAFGFSAMEIDTAVRHDLPIICVVSNNYGWRDVSYEQDAWFGEGRRIASDLADTRYDLMAEALGAHGEHVTTLDELRPALQRAHDSGKAAVVNVQTDPTVLSDLLRGLGELGIQ